MTGDRFPGFATHYYLGDKAPFLNLSDLPESELGVILDDLEQRRHQAGLKRVFGRRYMELRRLTEMKLRERFVQVGGKPERAAPHYFVLGSSPWYEGLAPDTHAITVSLTDLPSELTSFTYPDSFTAMGLLPHFGLPYEPRPYHEHVYRIEQLPAIVDRFGLPRTDDTVPDYDGHYQRPFEKYIEIQLWSDDPIRPFRTSGL